RQRLPGGRRRGDRLLRRAALGEVDRERAQRRRRRDGRVPAMSAASAPLVELRELSKSYGGVHALADVSFAIERASVHALVGENGAGKSTLVKILTGVVHPDAGEVLVEGAAQRIADPQAAHRLGIVAMYQEPTVFPDLTVAENVFAGRHPRTRVGAVDWRRMRSSVARLLDELG